MLSYDKKRNVNPQTSELLVNTPWNTAIFSRADIYNYMDRLCMCLHIDLSRSPWISSYKHSTNIEWLIRCKLWWTILSCYDYHNYVYWPRSSGLSDASCDEQYYHVMIIIIMYIIATIFCLFISGQFPKSQHSIAK